MKQKFTYLMLVFLTMGLTQTYAAGDTFGDAKRVSKNGQHVLAVKIAALMQKAKPKAKYADFLVVEYPLAVSEIETVLKDLPGKDMGFDKLADESAIWVSMYNALNKIPKTIQGKKTSVTITYVDYNAKHKEYIAKAIDQNYAAGEKLLTAKQIKDKDQGIKHFIRVNELNGDENFKESNKMIIQLAIAAANDTIANGLEIKQKIACISYFEMAEKYGYKEPWKGKVAEVYYTEGKSSTEVSTNFKSQVKFIDKYFVEALKYESPYKDIAEISAKIYYDEAEKNSQIKPNYKKMAEAEILYTKAIEYSPDYKDAKAKKKFAHLKKNIRLYIIDVNGSCTSNKTLVNSLPECFVVEKAEGTFPDNESMKKLAGKNALIIKLADNIDVKYSHSPRTTTSKTVTRYFAKNKEGEWFCSTKILNDASIKQKTLTASEVKSMSGKKNTEKESAKVTSVFAMEIWDMRNDSPILLKTKPLTTTKSFSYHIDTFEGPAEVKNCMVTLLNETDEIPTESEAQEYKVDDISEAFKMMKDIDKFAKFISNKAKYQ